MHLGELFSWQALAGNQHDSRINAELLDRLWPRTDHRSADNVTHLIASLRKKIEPDPQNPQIVVNVPRYGYKLDEKIVSVKIIEPPPSAPLPPRFSDSLQKELDKIRQECERQQQGLQTHHLLIALLKVSNGLTRNTLKQAKPNNDPGRVLKLLERAVSWYPIKGAGKQTRRYQRVIENARKIAQNAGSTKIEERHLFMAILLEADSGSPTVELLKRLGYDLNQLWSLTDPSSTDPNALKKILEG